MVERQKAENPDTASAQNLLAVLEWAQKGSGGHVRFAADSGRVRRTSSCLLL
jgi:hypothetical protein